MDKRIFDLGTATLTLEHKVVLDKAGNTEAESATLEELKDFLTGFLESVNIMNSNLTANGDRDQDMNAHFMHFVNGSGFVWQNGYASTPGQSSFDLQGFGSVNADELFNLKNGLGVTAMKFNGTGKVGFNGNPNNNARVQIKENSVWGLYIDSSGDTALVIESTGGRGVMSDSSVTYGGDFGSLATYALNLRGVSGIQYQLNGDNGRSGLRFYKSGSNGASDVFRISGDDRIFMSEVALNKNFANDVAAAVGGIEIGEAYHNAGQLRLRLS